MPLWKELGSEGMCAPQSDSHLGFYKILTFRFWEPSQALTWRISIWQIERRLNNHISLTCTFNSWQWLGVFPHLSASGLQLVATIMTAPPFSAASLWQGTHSNYVVWTAFPIKRTFFYIHIRCISSPRAIIHMTTLGAKRIAESLSPAKKQQRCDFFGAVLAVSARGGNIIPF